MHVPYFIQNDALHLGIGGSQYFANSKNASTCECVYNNYKAQKKYLHKIFLLKNCKILESCQVIKGHFSYLQHYKIEAGSNYGII